jgi:ketosteroid isomerase-like protein
VAAGDPWAGTVRRAIEDLRLGRLERAAETWHEDATWTVRCRPAHERDRSAPVQVIEHLRTLGRQTANTFRQRLIGLTGSDGPIVTAYVRTLARKGRRTLDQPSLLIFEVAAGRIRRVTELPGDVAAWCRFWDD